MRCEDGSWRQVLLEVQWMPVAATWRCETPDGTIDQSPHLVLFWVKNTRTARFGWLERRRMWSSQTLALVTLGWGGGWQLLCG